MRVYYCHQVDFYKDIGIFINFGDILNEFIFSLLSIPIEFSEDNPELYAIGSILNNLPEDYEGNIWSSGCIYPERTFSPKKPPIAVRGKLTLKQFSCDTTNTILGDGGLILEKIYKPICKRQYRLGVMFHYTDLVYQDPTSSFKNYKIFSSNDVVFIDPRKSPREIIDTLYSCHYVVSSCLHGIITCDSYKIPHALFCTHITNSILHGNQHSFKFNDYYSTFDMKFEGPKFEFLEDITIEECIKHCSQVEKKNLEKIKTDLLSSIKKFRLQ